MIIKYDEGIIQRRNQEIEKLKRETKKIQAQNAFRCIPVQSLPMPNEKISDI